MKMRMRNKLGTLASAAIFCCTASVGLAQAGSMQSGSAQQGGMQPNSTQSQQNQAMQSNSMGSMQGTGGSASPSDKVFVKKALQGSMAEIKAAQLALQKSSNDQVKQFAQKMIDDHTKLIDQMKPVAQQIGVAIPTGPDKKSQMMYAKLQTLSGPDFDQAYVKGMVKDHKEDDQQFKTEISSGQNSAVKDAATQGDPVIEAHLQMIQGIAKSMNLSSGM